MKSNNSLSFIGIAIFLLFVSTLKMEAVNPVIFEPVKNEKKVRLFIPGNSMEKITIRLIDNLNGETVTKSIIKNGEPYHKVWNFNYLPEGRYVMEIDMGDRVINQYFYINSTLIRKFADGLSLRNTSENTIVVK